MPLYSRTATSWDPQIILQCLLLLPLAQRPPCEIARPLFLHRTTARGCRVILHPSPVSTRYYFLSVAWRPYRISWYWLISNQLAPCFWMTAPFFSGVLPYFLYYERERDQLWKWNESTEERQNSRRLTGVGTPHWRLEDILYISVAFHVSFRPATVEKTQGRTGSNHLRSPYDKNTNSWHWLPISER